MPEVFYDENEFGAGVALWLHRAARHNGYIQRDPAFEDAHEKHAMRIMRTIDSSREVQDESLRRYKMLFPTDHEQHELLTEAVRDHDYLTVASMILPSDRERLLRAIAQVHF